MSAAQQQGSGGTQPVGRSPARTTSISPATSQRPFFYAGKVLLDSGTAPPNPVVILRVCNGIGRKETLTGADGSFSFMVGDKLREVTPDATDDTRTLAADNQLSSGRVSANSAAIPPNYFADCELRAELAGYDSSSIRLDSTMNNSTVGTIVLHSRTKTSDRMVTVASLQVPVKARKQFEKGSEQLEKGNLADAEQSLRQAIEQYPKFAEAWTRLGDLEQQRNSPDDARKDYQQAINADPNLPLPYLRLAILDANVQDWDNVRKLTDKVISLDPAGSPMAYYYNAVAEFYLDHLAKAESNALRAESMDKQHDEPRIELLLASICMAKDSYSAAADHYRAFLRLIPDGPMSQSVKIELAKIEQLAKSEAPPAPANK